MLIKTVDADSSMPVLTCCFEAYICWHLLVSVEF
jgi:hypothetical protein